MSLQASTSSVAAEGYWWHIGRGHTAEVGEYRFVVLQDHHLHDRLARCVGVVVVVVVVV